MGDVAKAVDVVEKVEEALVAAVVATAEVASNERLDSL